MPELPVKHDTNEDVFRGQLFIFIDGKPIAFASNATLDMTTEEVDASNKMTGDWDSPLPGKNGYTASSESMMSRKEGHMSVDTLMERWRKRQTVDFYFGSAKITEQTNQGGKFELDKTQKYYTGKMMITNLSITSQSGSLATSSASFKGIGALDEGVLEGTPTT